MAHEKLIKNLDDNILVNRIKRNYKSNSAVQELKLRHENLYFTLLYKTLNKNLNEKRDLEDDCLYFIYDAAKTFNPHKHTKFSSYLGLLIRWKSLNLNSFNNKYQKNNLDKIEESDILEINNKIFYDQNTLQSFIKFLETGKDRRAKKIFKLRYFKNKKKPMIWAKVGKQVNLTAQGCINIHNQTIEKFLEKNKTKI